MKLPGNLTFLPCCAVCLVCAAILQHLSALGLPPSTQLQKQQLKAAFHKAAMQVSVCGLWFCFFLVTLGGGQVLFGIVLSLYACQGFSTLLFT